jgi:hypothetical protein
VTFYPIPLASRISTDSGVNGLTLSERESTFSIRPP